MIRALIGASVGMLCAILLVAALGGWDGYTNGMATNRLPPGMHAAMIDAFYCVMYFWPVPAACGAVIGGLAGFGSWLVRPRGNAAYSNRSV